MCLLTFWSDQILYNALNKLERFKEIQQNSRESRRNHVLTVFAALIGFFETIF